MHSSWFCLLLIMRVTAKNAGPIDYHEHVGVPLAKWIKKTEDEIHARPVSGRRIIGGSVAPPNLFPYLGGLLVEVEHLPTPSACGSVLITTHNLLTAAHCWKSVNSQARRLTVVLGSEFLYTGGLRLITSSVVMHPQFTPYPVFNDIAIIKLSATIASSDSIKPIALPYLYVNKTFDDEWVTTAGYGRTQTDIPVSLNSVISHVMLQVMPVPECGLYFVDNVIGPKTICTDGSDGVGVCDGDSGGPLVSIQNKEAILIGVTSFSAVGNCEDGNPSVYSRVTSFLDFIKQNI